METELRWPEILQLVYLYNLCFADDAHRDEQALDYAPYFELIASLDRADHRRYARQRDDRRLAGLLGDIWVDRLGHLLRYD